MNLDIEGLDELQENITKLANKGVKELNRGLERINNSDSTGKANVPEKCPYCGAALPVDSSAPVIKCEYCGAEFDNGNEGSIVDSIFDFVEKQKDINLREREIKLQQMKIKAEEKKAKRKKSIKRKFFLILIIIFFILWCYFYVMGGVVQI